MSVKEYKNEFTRLIKFLPIALRDYEHFKTLKFLKSKLQSAIRSFELSTYAAVVNKVKLIEQNRK